MNRLPREFAAGLAGLTGLALLLAMVSLVPKSAKGIKVLVASNYRHNADDCADGGMEIIGVLAAGLEFNGHPITRSALETTLQSLMRNRAERVVFVDGDAAVRFADVASVLSLLHSLKIEAAMLTPGLDRKRCVGTPAPSLPPLESPQFIKMRAQMQPVPWWRFW